jgi:hypothetical protein
MILKLNSVGCVINTDTKMVYPMYNEKFQKIYRRIYDENSGIHLDECSKEWVDALSEDDIMLINETDWVESLCKDDIISVNKNEL